MKIGVFFPSFRDLIGDGADRSRGLSVLKAGAEFFRDDLKKNSDSPPVWRSIGDLSVQGRALEHAQSHKPGERSESHMSSYNNGMIDRFAAWLCEVAAWLFEVDIDTDDQENELDGTYVLTDASAGMTMWMF